MNGEITEKVVELGRKYNSLKERLGDLKFLTDPAFALEITEGLAFVRSELVAIGAAFRLEDNTIIIKSDFIVSFLEPNFPTLTFSKRSFPDLKNPEIVRKIALSCGLSQWIFLASQLKNETEREEFLKTCSRIVGQQTRKND